MEHNNKQSRISHNLGLLSYSGDPIETLETVTRLSLAATQRNINDATEQCRILQPPGDAAVWRKCTGLTRGGGGRPTDMHHFPELSGESAQELVEHGVRLRLVGSGLRGLSILRCKDHVEWRARTHSLSMQPRVTRFCKQSLYQYTMIATLMQTNERRGKRTFSW